MEDVLKAAALTFVTAAAAWWAYAEWRFRRRWRRWRSGVCVHCGYDLRSSFSRCPECGEPIQWR